MEYYEHIYQAQQIIATAIREHNPSHVIGLFSGGHDSLCATHLAMTYIGPRLPKFVAHINTGVGIEQTRRYVRRTSADLGWLLKEYHPPVTYAEIVRKWGFPGPAGPRERRRKYGYCVVDWYFYIDGSMDSSHNPRMDL